MLVYWDEPSIGWLAVCIFEIGEDMMERPCSAGDGSLGIGGTWLNKGFSHPWYPSTSWCMADLDVADRQMGCGLGSMVIPDI